MSVVGDFNAWRPDVNAMRCLGDSGIWETFTPGVAAGALYKYAIVARDGERLPLKADPFAFAMQHPPDTASIVMSPSVYAWGDAAWLAKRGEVASRAAPISIYEVHLGSWQRVPQEGNRPLTYIELAERLVPHVRELGFTHIEVLPIAEHPFAGSWGYQPLGHFAPSSRHGSPDDLRHFIDRCHAAGIGLILDWVPGHFPDDAHGLGRFDGTNLYEHADPRQGRHADWDTLIFNLGRWEVADYLISNALYWIEEFHVDGLRVDAVASMLYLDYSRPLGKWVPNRHGGNINLEAVEFLRRLNTVVSTRNPDVVMIAEESTAWPMVSRPAEMGGLGFGYKWNMGWMNDTLRYMRRDPIHRKHHHDELTFPLMYAFSESFVLPLSHDEVVHGKGSLIGRMPGDRWQRFANLRAYLAYMFTHPGKKLLFMGAELAQEREWSHDRGLDWHLLDDPWHGAIRRLVGDLNRLYRQLPALHAHDCEASGFEWIDCNDRDGSAIIYLRRAASDSPRDLVLIACNFTPVPRLGHRVGVPRAGRYTEILNTDSCHYGGSNLGNLGGVESEPVPAHGHPQSLSLTLPPLATIVLQPEGS